jgi:DNA repair photolyase
MKNFKGKSIYTSGGPAAEYGKYGCGFYVGCSNGCIYCYLQKPPFKKACGGNVPTLKKHFKDENHALEIFEKELKANLPELQKHGLFFSFTTDPLLPETSRLTYWAIEKCLWHKVPVKILTKCARPFLCNSFFECLPPYVGGKIAVGFTLTGYDELEPNASTNAERIEAMRKLHEAGFKTWASIEPIVDTKSSFNMIFDAAGFCDLYKIGLMSGKQYVKDELLWLISRCHGFTNIYKEYNFPIKFYFKDNLLKQAGINREDLPANCVGRDYNMFNN